MNMLKSIQEITIKEEEPQHGHRFRFSVWQNGEKTHIWEGRYRGTLLEEAIKEAKNILSTNKDQ